MRAEPNGFLVHLLNHSDTTALFVTAIYGDLHVTVQSLYIFPLGYNYNYYIINYLYII